ncbi:MAG: DUF1540 domain-containing protein [Tissierellia bacterium]|nr:DUF1540 domain-containing protein [Tissierellia bacterium]MDD4780739.1 DUF1540 domain-containing protein [Tissierellia bacterium]
MAEISCTVTNCYYNKRNGCTSPVIKVDGKKASESRNTSCNTFVEQKPGIMSSTAEPQNNSSVECEATKCVYNKNATCKASDILVNGKNAQRHEETCCSTFRAH